MGYFILKLLLIPFAHPAILHPLFRFAQDLIFQRSMRTWTGSLRLQPRDTRAQRARAELVASKALFLEAVGMSYFIQAAVDLPRPPRNPPSFLFRFTQDPIFTRSMHIWA